MGKVQVIKTTANEMVILARDEYERLRKLAARAERDEDAGTRRVIRRERARVARGEEVLVPQAYADRIAAGENPIFVVREWRGIKQRELANEIGIGQGYLSDIEHGRRRGTAEVLAKIARALAVPLDLLVE
jgi:ribosome-binding protein aMBF1 (putative translation factor)